MPDSKIVWTGEWLGDDEGLRELQPFVEQQADGMFFGGYDFSYRGGEPRRCYEPELISTLAAARKVAQTAVQNWLRASVESEALQEAQLPVVETPVSAPKPPRAGEASPATGPVDGHQHGDGYVASAGGSGHASAQAGEIVTYWLYHKGEFVGAKRMPVGTSADDVRAAARDDATVTCDRLWGETPIIREMRIMNASVRVYDDRPAQERARRDLPFELRGLFPKELPFFELTFRADGKGVNREQRLIDLLQGLEQIASREGLGLAGLGELGWPYDHMVRVESSDANALGQCEVAMKACLAASGADLVSEFGVGYVRIEAPVAYEGSGDALAAIGCEPQGSEDDESEANRPSF